MMTRRHTRYTCVPLHFIGNPNGTELVYKGTLFLSHAPPREPLFLSLSQALFLSRAPRKKMQYNGLTFHCPRTTPEQQYLPGVIVETTTLRVYAQSRWRGPVDLARDFLAEGFSHLTRGSPIMYHLNDVRDGVALKLLMVTFSNPFDAYELLGELFWCGCECIFFTNYNIFTNCTSIFATKNHIHCLPYDK
jgi:hypothetical protein